MEQGEENRRVGGLATALAGYRIASAEEVDAVVAQIIRAAIARGAALKEQVEREAELLERELERLTAERQALAREIEEARRRASQEAEAIRADAERYAAELVAQAQERRTALQAELAALEEQVARARKRVAAQFDQQIRLFKGAAADHQAGRADLAASPRAPAPIPSVEPPGEERADGPGLPARAGRRGHELAEDSLAGAPNVAESSSLGDAPDYQTVVVEGVASHSAALAVQRAIRQLDGIREVGIVSFERGALTLEVRSTGGVDVRRAVARLADHRSWVRSADVDGIRFAVAG